MTSNLTSGNPQPTPFPEFLKATIYDGRTGDKYPANTDYFATESTALWIAETYGDGKLSQSDLLGTGPFYCDTKMQMFSFTPPYPGKGDPPEPRWLNAGIYAAYYKRNPQDLYPGVADKLIKAELAKEV